MNKSYRKVLIFGGTTEGRGVAERLLAQGVPCTVSVATQYGEEVMEPHPLLEIHTGRLEQGAMAQLMRDGLFCCVVDATHPHAQEVSAQIRAACEIARRAAKEETFLGNFIRAAAAQKAMVTAAIARSGNRLAGVPAIRKERQAG